ncbi:unnamed protein product [Closterium sp. Yama58-4]|nr:unnamed protein product [Closterium sp. Yama58-4]
MPTALPLITRFLLPRTPAAASRMRQHGQHGWIPSVLHMLLRIALEPLLNHAALSHHTPSLPLNPQSLAAAISPEALVGASIGAVEFESAFSRASNAHPMCFHRLVLPGYLKAITFPGGMEQADMFKSRLKEAFPHPDPDPFRTLASPDNASIGDASAGSSSADSVTVRLLYITRNASLTRGRRVMSAESSGALLKLFHQLKFQVAQVEFTPLTFAHQLALVQAADIIVSLHGAGLTNPASFARSDSVLLEISPYGVFYNLYYFMAVNAGVTYMLHQCTAGPAPMPAKDAEFRGVGPFSYVTIEAPPSMYPAKKYCDITGLEAPYTDPHSKLRYANPAAFAIARSLPHPHAQAFLALRGAHTIPQPPPCHGTVTAAPPSLAISSTMAIGSSSNASTIHSIAGTRTTVTPFKPAHASCGNALFSLSPLVPYRQTHPLSESLRPSPCHSLASPCCRYTAARSASARRSIAAQAGGVATSGGDRAGGVTITDVTELGVGGMEGEGRSVGKGSGGDRDGSEGGVGMGSGENRVGSGSAVGMDSDIPKVVWELEKETKELLEWPIVCRQVADCAPLIRDLTDRIVALDLACARARHALWMGASAPVLLPPTHPLSHAHGDAASAVDSPGDSGLGRHALVGRECDRIESYTVEIRGIQHPVLLEMYLDAVSAAQSRAGKSSTGAADTNAVAATGGGGAEAAAAAAAAQLPQPTPPVPIDLLVPSGVAVVVISGPNAGGKTAALKTLGIAALMAKAGLFLPLAGDVGGQGGGEEQAGAAESGGERGGETEAEGTGESRGGGARGRVAVVRWFDRVVADIGDEQSLEQSLSTFSAHMRQVSRILLASSPHSPSSPSPPSSSSAPSSPTSPSSPSSSPSPAFSSPSSSSSSSSSSSPSSPSLSPATSATLVLLDEAGSGTDPSEGAALAAAILKHLAGCNGLTLATTHYADLKKLKEASLAGVPERAATDQACAEVAALAALAGLSPEADSALVSDASVGSSGGDSGGADWVPALGEPVYVRRFGISMRGTVVAVGGGSGEGSGETAAARSVTVQLGNLRLQVQREDLLPATDGSGGGGQSSTDGEAGRRGGTGGSFGSRWEQDDDSNNNSNTNSSRRLKRGGQFPSPSSASSTPLPAVREAAVQTARNTVDVRGRSAEDALAAVDLAVQSSPPGAVLFIVHGLGTGVLRAAVLKYLSGSPLVSRHEAESRLNIGCTIAYIG